nr:hypothetical protein [Nanoarchaeota archaeon]
MKDKIRLGYTNEYAYAEDLDKKNADKLIKERNIKCSYCGSKLKKGDWVSIVHTPGNHNKPKRLHFFCHSKNCHHNWGLKSQKEREG